MWSWDISTILPFSSFTLAEAGKQPGGGGGGGGGGSGGSGGGGGGVGGGGTAK